MSFLTVNHSEGNNKSGEFTPIPEGTYEAIIKEVEVTKSSAGNDMIKMTLVIRDDVKQQAGKRKIWDYLVSSEKAKWKFQQVAKALKIPEGTNIATLQDFAKAVLYSSVKITIKHRQEEYNGETKTRESIAVYESTDIPLNASANDPFASTPAPTNNSPF
jgi:hypothetical protein